jgi:hypothetical protein
MSDTNINQYYPTSPEEAPKSLVAGEAPGTVSETPQPIVDEDTPEVVPPSTPTTEEVATPITDLGIDLPEKTQKLPTKFSARGTKTFSIS